MGHAVEVEGLGKRYSLGEDFGRYLTIRDSVSARLRRKSRNGGSELWALRDVTFALEEGEVLGIVGRNGAGKTTLLRILSRITEPTTGVTRTRGRVGTLLDVGTGFHPELTGRENIYLNGAILGMPTGQITGRFDEIVEFADVERFLDTPLKRYSSGMQVRLAFSVAAHLEPEIVIVDEVLAVGDVAFQQKCLGKMTDVARDGRTVLFVSHSMGAIESLCDRVLWLEHGRLADDGSPRAVIEKYLASATHLKTSQEWHDPLEAPGNDRVRLRSAKVYPKGGAPHDAITVHTPIVLEFQYENLKEEAHLNVSLHLYSSDGVLVLNAVPVNEPMWFGAAYPKGRFRDRCIIPGDLLNNGSYRVELLVVKDKSAVLHQDSAVLEFEVHDVVEASDVYEGDWAGVVRPALEWQTDLLGDVERQLEG